jgi:hypothetical protein
MALNKPDRVAIIKAAGEADRLKEIKFSKSLGSVKVNNTTYTDRHYAVNNIKGKK